MTMEMDMEWWRHREVIPLQPPPPNDHWRHISLNTGGTQSMLQDIKLPERAGGYFYKDSSKYYTRNRYICWRISHDTLEVVEQSLEMKLSGCRVRWRGGGALLGACVFERPGSVILLVTSVCSVHRLIFPHPDIIHKQEKQIGRDLEDSSPSILNEASAAQALDPKHFHIISHHTNANFVVPHTCSMALNNNGEALFAIAGAGGSGGSAGILLVRLNPAGGALTTLLRQESIVPRFLSALRGNRNEGEVSCGLSLSVTSQGVKLYALGRDARIRVWCCERATCIAVHPLLTDQNESITHGTQTHMLRSGETSTGELLLGAFLCFSTESRFTVLKPSFGEQNTVSFTLICHLFGPERDLVDFGVCGSGIWAVWGSSGSGERDVTVTASALGPTAQWRSCLSASLPSPELLPQTDHYAYLECLFRPGLFPIAVIAKALSIYERSSEAAQSTTQSIIDSEMDERGVLNLRMRALAAARAAEQRHAARTQLDPEDLMHKCWSELYSWCVQYLEVWRKPQGLVLSNHENGGWCLLLRQGGVSFFRPLELLEHLLLSEDASEVSTNYLCSILSADETVCRWICTVVGAAGEVGRRLPEGAKAAVRAGLSLGRAPEHLLPQLAEDLLADGEDGSPPVFSAEVIAVLARKLATIGDLPRALLALNQALRLDCEDEGDDEDTSCGDFETLFCSDLGVSLATDTLYQMAQVRFSICCNLLILGAMLNGSSQKPWPVAGHTGVSLQAYNALCWLCETTLGESENHDSLKSGIERLSLLKLCSGELRDSGLKLSSATGRAAGIVWWFTQGAGGCAARRLLMHKQITPHLHWTRTLHPYVHCLGHLLWGVSGGFTFGTWLAASGRPTLVKNYAALLAPWCEWNASSREFIVGMALLDTAEPHKALAAFLRAGQGAINEPFLARLLPRSSQSSRNALLNYYLKVIKLFELHKSPECIISLAEKAINIADKDDPHLSVFHSLVFRTWLELEQWERALAAAGAHPDSEQRDNCVARLVAALGERRCLPHLLAPGAPPPPPTTCRVAEQRARLCDEPYNHYYNFLYAYYIKCGDMRKAADVMYEQASRIGNEMGARADALGRRARCLLAALNCLSLVAPKHAFLVVSRIPALAEKRDNRGEIVERNEKDREVIVLGVEDLRKELHIVTARLKFAKTQPDQMCPEIGVEEVASLLSGVGLHVAAITLRERLGAPRAPALAALAAAAAALPSLPTNASQAEAQADMDAWRWLAENDITELSIGERSASGAAWALLKALVGDTTIESNNKVESRSSILHAVASRLLSVGVFLPHWLLSEYKTIDVSSLIRLMTRHGRLSEAAAIGIEALRASRPDPRPNVSYHPVCSPLPALDLLLAELQYQADNGEDFYAQLYEEMEELVKHHCESVQRATDNLKEVKVT